MLGGSLVIESQRIGVRINASAHQDIAAHHQRIYDRGLVRLDRHDSVSCAAGSHGGENAELRRPAHEAPLVVCRGDPCRPCDAVW